MARLLIFLFFALFSNLFLKAAPPEDLDEDDFLPVPWFSKQQLNSPFPVDTNYVDTTLAGFHRYDPYFRKNLFIAEKGNIGHAGVSMLFEPNLQSDFSLNPAPLYPGHLFDSQTIRFFRPRYVFTDLKFITGDSREQLFVANHNQKLHETLYVGAIYQIVNSPGFYDRMAARNSNIQVHFDFQESTGKYGALGSVVFNRINNQESGGLSDYRSFEENSNRENVFLNQAVSRYNENIFNLDQYYNLGFYLHPEDTLSEPSYTSLGRLGHQFSYRRQALLFDEGTLPNANFFETPPVFSTNTYDSTVVHTIENELSWSNYPLYGEGGSFPVSFKVFALHRMVRIRQPDHSRMFIRNRIFQTKLPGFRSSSTMQKYLFLEDQFSQLVTGLEAESDPTRILAGKIKGDYIAGGYNDGDLNLWSSVSLGVASSYRHTLSLDLHYAEKEAPYFLSHFEGNYVSWSNDFEKAQWLTAGSRYQNPWFAVEANYYRVKNYAFMGPEALPVQNPDGVNVFSALISSELGVGVLRTSHQLIFQKVDDDFFMNLPELAGRHTLYFDFFMFSRALAVQTGVDVFYNLAYAPMAYMPVVRQFYAQDNFSGRDNLMVDVFADLKVSRTRIFVKLENFQGLVTDLPPVYLIPFYPVPQAAFKFGLSWMFFD